MQQSTALEILKTGRNVYLTGAAGAGKTHVLNAYIEYLKGQSIPVGITASTGIAATHIGGMTIHAWSGIGIKDFLSEWDLDDLTQRQYLAKRIMRASVLIIDEVSMLPPHVLEMVDAVTRAVRQSNEPFGGLQVVLSGDFYQLPPVVNSSEHHAFVNVSEAWQGAQFKICYLTEQYRQKADPLTAILNDIRDGELSDVSRKKLLERVQKQPVADDAVVLHTHNANVDVHNKKKLTELKGHIRKYTMKGSGRANLVASLEKGVLAPGELELKEHAKVMFVKNNPEEGYMNGTLGKVVDLSGEYPIVELINKERLTVYPAQWEVQDNGKVLASVEQVPLRLAWAITVHKSQGMSLDAVDIDLSKAFVPGQGYVALSRARTLSGLVLRGLNETALQVDSSVCELDEYFRKQSAVLEKQFGAFSGEKKQSLQEDFRQVASKKDVLEKTPTHHITKEFLKQELDIDEVARARELTKETIISHLEKLKKEGSEECFAHVRPQEKIIQLVGEVLEESTDDKLAPIHRKLKGKYTYAELRLARLFVHTA